jgi:hypothetical protein
VCYQTASLWTVSISWEPYKARARISPPREEVFVGYAAFAHQWFGSAIRYRNWIQGATGGPQAADDRPNGTVTPAKGAKGGIPGEYLLYDLGVDLEEQFDVAAEYPLMVEILQVKLQEYQRNYVPPTNRVLLQGL